MKISGQMGNDSGIMPLNSPGGSTLQWSMRRDLMHPAAFFYLHHNNRCNSQRHWAIIQYVNQLDAVR